MNASVCVYSFQDCSDPIRVALVLLFSSLLLSQAWTCSALPSLCLRLSSQCLNEFGRVLRPEGGKKNNTPRHNTLLGLDDSEQRPRTNTNQVTTLKTMSTGGPSPAKTTCNPIICLGENHVLTEWRVGEAGVCFLVTVSVDFFSIHYKLIRPKTLEGSNRSCCLTACLFLF